VLEIKQALKSTALLILATCSVAKSQSAVDSKLELLSLDSVKLKEFGPKIENYRYDVEINKDFFKIYKNLGHSEYKVRKDSVKKLSDLISSDHTVIPQIAACVRKTDFSIGADNKELELNLRDVFKNAKFSGSVLLFYYISFKDPEIRKQLFNAYIELSKERFELAEDLNHKIYWCSPNEFRIAKECMSVLEYDLINNKPLEIINGSIKMEFFFNKLEIISNRKSIIDDVEEYLKEQNCYEDDYNIFFKILRSNASFVREDLKTEKKIKERLYAKPVLRKGFSTISGTKSLEGF